MLWPIIITLAAMLISPSLAKLLKVSAGRILFVVPLTIVVWLLALHTYFDMGFSYVDDAGSLVMDGLFRLNGLSLLFALLVTGIGTVVLPYTSVYFDNKLSEGAFVQTLLMLQIGMLGIAFSNHLLLLVFFWELTAIATWLLIRFKSDKAEVLAGAVLTYRINAIGSVSLLIGSFFLANAGGSWSLLELVANADAIIAHADYPVILVCVLIAGLTKSAQFPFHRWMPKTILSPTPASASAGMVKSGVFLLMLFFPILGGSPMWAYTLMIIGMATMFIGAVTGLQQTHLKLILAYATISAMGLMVALIGIGSVLSLKSAMLFLFGQVISKAALFMSVGIIQNKTGEVDVLRLGGLCSVMPLTAVAVALAALSKAGFPPFFGSIKKELLIKTGVLHNELGVILLVFSLVVNSLLMAMTLTVGLHPYWSKKVRPKQIKISGKMSLNMTQGILILGFLGMLLGMYPQQFVTPLIAPALSVIFGERIDFTLTAWKGISVNLFFSLLTMATGIVIYKIKHEIWNSVGKKKDHY